MSSYEVVERGAAAGIVITASHNPWTDNGFKVKSPHGLGGRAGHARGASRRAIAEGAPIERRPFADAEAAGLVERYDPYEGYERYVRRTVDLDALKAADVAVLVEPMWGAGAGWLAEAARRRPHPRHRDPPGAQPVLRRRQPRADPAEHRRGARDPGEAAATTWACSSTATRIARERPTSRATFIHQLEVTGLLMYYLAEHRGLRQPVVISVNNTSMAARLGEHYGIEAYESPVGYKFIGPKMIETGAMMGAEESGGFGFGMHLPERDGIYADLLLLDLFLREKARGVLAGLEDRRPVPRARRAVVLSADRRPRRAGRLCGDEAPAARGARWTRRRPRSPASRSPGPQPLDHERRLQVLRRRRLVAADPDLRHRAARARLHGGDLARRPRRAGRRGREARPWLRHAVAEPRAARPPRRGLAGRRRRPRELPRRVDKPWGHEVIWAHTDRYVGKILHDRDGQAPLAPVPRRQGRVDPGPLGPAAADPRERRGDVEDRELGPGEGAHVRTGRRHRYEAIETCTLIEVSTPELDDVVRIEDDFGREGTFKP